MTGSLEAREAQQVFKQPDQIDGAQRLEERRETAPGVTGLERRPHSPTGLGVALLGSFMQLDQPNLADNRV